MVGQSIYDASGKLIEEREVNSRGEVVSFRKVVDGVRQDWQSTGAQPDEDKMSSFKIGNRTINITEVTTSGNGKMERTAWNPKTGKVRGRQTIQKSNGKYKITYSGDLKDKDIKSIRKLVATEETLKARKIERDEWKKRIKRTQLNIPDLSSSKGLKRALAKGGLDVLGGVAKGIQKADIVGSATVGGVFAGADIVSTALITSSPFWQGKALGVGIKALELGIGVKSVRDLAQFFKSKQYKNLNPDEKAEVLSQLATETAVMGVTAHGISKFAEKVSPQTSAPKEEFSIYREKPKPSKTGIFDKLRSRKSRKITQDLFEIEANKNILKQKYIQEQLKKIAEIKKQTKQLAEKTAKAKLEATDLIVTEKGEVIPKDKASKSQLESAYRRLLNSEKSRLFKLDNKLTRAEQSLRQGKTISPDSVNLEFFEAEKPKPSRPTRSRSGGGRSVMELLQERAKKTTQAFKETSKAVGGGGVRLFTKIKEPKFNFPRVSIPVFGGLYYPVSRAKQRTNNILAQRNKQQPRTKRPLPTTQTQPQLIFSRGNRVLFPRQKTKSPSQSFIPVIAPVVGGAFGGVGISRALAKSKYAGGGGGVYRRKRKKKKTRGYRKELTYAQRMMKALWG